MDENDVREIMEKIFEKSADIADIINEVKTDIKNIERRVRKIENTLDDHGID